MYDDSFDSFDTVEFERDLTPISMDNIIDGEAETSVDGIKADAVYAAGIDHAPIFNVDADTFYDNQNGHNRGSITLPDDSPVKTYADSTSQGEFYLRYTSDGGTQLKRIRS